MKRMLHCTALLAAVIAVAGLSVSVLAQSQRVDGGTLTIGNLGFYWETHLEPSSPALANGFGTTAIQGKGVIHRIMIDSGRRMYFGYDVTIAELADATGYRVAFRHLALTPELAQKILGEDAAQWTLLPAPAYPPASTIRAGDVLALPLLVSASGQRIVDYVTVQEPSRRFRGFDSVPDREFAFAPGVPRDFRADDAHLHIREPRLSINGRLHESTADARGDEAGPILWFYVPKRGRFLVSLTPNGSPGFRKAGEVRGSSLRFVVEADTYSLVSASRIAPGDAAFNLYVLRDPTWVPTYPNADLSAFILGASPRRSR